MKNTQLINGFPFLPHVQKPWNEHESHQKAQAMCDEMAARRSVRDFSTQAVPIEIINHCLRTACSAPSGANKQPWVFCVVADPTLKKQIRMAAEREEYESYHNRMSDEWLHDLKPLQTNWEKPFLETAPYLIVVFRKSYELGADGSKKINYYVNESVGLACGFLLAAIHHAGLVALTHTPSPMNFLMRLLARPENERPFLLIPVGLPAAGALVPDIRRKAPEEVTFYYD